MTALGRTNWEWLMLALNFAAMLAALPFSYRRATVRRSFWRTHIWVIPFTAAYVMLYLLTGDATFDVLVLSFLVCFKYALSIMLLGDGGELNVSLSLATAAIATAYLAADVTIFNAATFFNSRAFHVGIRYVIILTTVESLRLLWPWIRAYNIRKAPFAPQIEAVWIVIRRRRRPDS